MPHDDYAVFAAIAAITGLTSLALVLGTSDGILATAVAVLAGLGGFKLAQSRARNGG